MKYFVEAARRESISQAAQKLGISQPAVSRQIRLLEEELEIPLFTRDKQRIQLNEAGVFFLEKAQAIIADITITKEQIKERFSSNLTSLRLSFMGIMVDDLIVPTLRTFSQIHPEVKISMFELSPADQYKRILAGELDVAITGNIPDPISPEVSVKVIAHNKMAAVIPDNHLLACRDKIEISELKDEYWVTLCETSFPNRSSNIESLFYKSGYSPKVLDEEPTIPLVLGKVGIGEGISLLPQHASKIPHKGSRFISISPSFSVPLYLLMNETYANNRSLALAKYLEQRAKEIFD